MTGPNSFIYLSLLAGLIFTIYSLIRIQSLPNLAEVVSLMLSVAAAHSGVALCFYVLEGSKSLGDFKDQKLIIVLGAIAVCWVSLVTCISLVKSLNGRASIKAEDRAPAATGSGG